MEWQPPAEAEAAADTRSWQPPAEAEAAAGHPAAPLAGFAEHDNIMAARVMEHSKLMAAAVERLRCAAAHNNQLTLITCYYDGKFTECRKTAVLKIEMQGKTAKQKVRPCCSKCGPDMSDSFSNEGAEVATIVKDCFYNVTDPQDVQLMLQRSFTP